MSLAAPLTAAAELRRPMPATSAARADAAEAAVASLRHEHRRLQRLGFELPLARCEHQLRYWSFVRAICALEPAQRVGIARSVGRA